MFLPSLHIPLRGAKCIAQAPINSKSIPINISQKHFPSQPMPIFFQGPGPQVQMGQGPGRSSRVRSSEFKGADKSDHEIGAKCVLASYSKKPNFRSMAREFRELFAFWVGLRRSQRVQKTHQSHSEVPGDFPDRFWAGSRWTPKKQHFAFYRVKCKFAVSLKIVF